MVYLTRIEKFNAAHKLWVPEWSDAENDAVFGKCANRNWHGHNYALHVTVKGSPNPTTGFIIDAKKLAQIIRIHATDLLDHSNLNLDVPFIPKNLQPTTENLVILIWNQLASEIFAHGCQLHRIQLWETDTIYAEFFGEN
jgi:6-pyruvoyltetrahydropterin/6-carboxytetrahydropterin synthase